MTNAQIIAELIGCSEAAVLCQFESSEPCVSVVDLVELNAALDKAREEERKAIE